MAIIIPVFMKKLKVRDMLLAIIGVVSLLLQCLLRGSWQRPAGLYMSFVAGMFAPISMIAIRSRLSKIIHEDETGKVFSLMATVESIMPSLASVYYSSIFAASIDTYPGLAFQIAAFIFLVKLLSQSIYRTAQLLKDWSNTYWTQNNIFIAVFIFTWISLLWDIYLSLRQYNIYRTTRQVPKELRPEFDSKTFNTCIEYNSLRLRFGFVADVYHQILTAIVLWFDVIPLVWRICGRLLVGLNFAANNELIHSILFVMIGSLLSAISGLPISLYRTFVV
ncbi:unnamed protein product, partial [Oppiella nova]